MEIVQGLVTNWIAALALLLPFGYAFGAGMVAAVNPCGFVMLPAYLSLYLGAQEAEFASRSSTARVLRGLAVGGSVSLGFILLFALVGLIVSAGGHYLMALTPLFGAAVGLLLVALGLWLLAGRDLYAGVFERLAERLGGARRPSVGGFFVFGLAYGTASLGCTLPVFLVVVGGGMAAGGVARGLLQFLSYGLGMAAIVVTLTIALALLKQGVANGLRRAIPYVQRVAAVLLLLAGVYLFLYWWPNVGLAAGA